MRIGLVGGLGRGQDRFAKIAADAGHTLEHHSGVVHGRGSGELRTLVERSGFVIILITINSHQGVRLAKHYARKYQRPAIVMPKCGQVAFREILKQMG